jgi:hypothetical protein
MKRLISFRRIKRDCDNLVADWCDRTDNKKYNPHDFTYGKCCAKNCPIWDKLEEVK